MRLRNSQKKKKTVVETGNYLGKEEVVPTSKSSVQCTSVSTKQKYDFIIADWLQNRMILKREAVLLSQDIGKKKTPESGVLLPTVVCSTRQYRPSKYN